MREKLKEEIKKCDKKSPITDQVVMVVGLSNFLSSSRKIAA
jgi:hypothetical protein